MVGCRGAGIPSGPAALSQMAQQVGSRLLRRVPGVAGEPSSSCAKVAHALGPGGSCMSRHESAPGRRHPEANCPEDANLPEIIAGSQS